MRKKIVVRHGGKKILIDEIKGLSAKNKGKSIKSMNKNQLVELARPFLKEKGLIDDNDVLL